MNNIVDCVLKNRFSNIKFLKNKTVIVIKLPRRYINIYSTQTKNGCINPNELFNQCLHYRILTGLFALGLRYYLIKLWSYFSEYFKAINKTALQISHISLTLWSRLENKQNVQVFHTGSKMTSSVCILVPIIWRLLETH